MSQNHRYVGQEGQKSKQIKAIHVNKIGKTLLQGLIKCSTTTPGIVYKPSVRGSRQDASQMIPPETNPTEVLRNREHLR